MFADNRSRKSLLSFYQKGVGELTKFFGVSDDYFISLQDDIDIRNLKIELAEELEKIKTFVPA